MDNVQATSPSPIQAAAAAAMGAGDVTAEADPGAGPTGFQLLLAQQLEGLPELALAVAADEDLLADAETDAPPGAPDSSMLALLQMVPVLPPPVPVTGSAGAVTFDAGTDAAEPMALGAVAVAVTGAGARGAAPALVRDQPRATLDTAAEALSTQGFDRASLREPPAAGYEAGAGSAQTGFMPAAQPAPPATPAAAIPAQIQLATPLAHAAWGEDLGQKLVWMINDKQHVAALHVNPPQLGPLDIKLTMDGSETTAIFTSPHIEVRQAIESALPRLREVLADSGIMLGNASVTADSPRDGSAFSQARPGFGRQSADGTAAESEPERAIHVVRGRGVVDLFA